MATITFYTHPLSRGRLGRVFLEEIAEPYEEVVLDFTTTMKAPDYLSVNPMGKVPAIRHGDAVVTECAAIAAYLGDAFPAAGLAPAPGDAARGAYYRWLFFAAGPLEAAVFDNANEVRIPAEMERAAGYGSLSRVLDTVEAALEPGDWLAGAGPTMADIYVGAQLRYFMQINAIAPRPAFSRLAERLAERPGHKRATERDDALAQEMGLFG